MKWIVKQSDKNEQVEVEKVGEWNKWGKGNEGRIKEWSKTEKRLVKEEIKK